MADIKNYAVFRERPLVMCANNTMVYGNMNEQAYAEIIMLMDSVEGMLMVTIKTCGTDEILRPNEFKQGLYEALEYSCEQIDRYNKK